MLRFYDLVHYAIPELNNVSMVPALNAAETGPFEKRQGPSCSIDFEKVPDTVGEACDLLGLEAETCQ